MVMWKLFRVEFYHRRPGNSLEDKGSLLKDAATIKHKASQPEISLHAAQSACAQARLSRAFMLYFRWIPAYAGTTK
jgi:hypothetical protein